MVIYKLSLKYKSLSEIVDGKPALNPELDEKKLAETVSDANEALGQECALDGNLSVFITGCKPGNLELDIICNQENAPIDVCKQWIEKHFAENFSLAEACIADIVEISVKRLKEDMEGGMRRNLGNCGPYNLNELKLDYLENYYFDAKETVYDNSFKSKEEALARAKEIMGGESLFEELDRIYSDKNRKEYFGNPVHYMIKAGSQGVAKDIIEVIMKALKANFRTLGGRLTYLSNIEENCHDEEDLENLFKASKGVAIAVEMSGDDGDHGVYASAYQEVVSDFAKHAVENQLYTLCFFVELTEKPGFAESLVAAVNDDIHIIEICEGRGDRSRALEYLSKLANDAKFAATEEELESALAERPDYTPSEVYSAYSKWFSNGLKCSVYTAYRECEKMVLKVGKKESEPYEKLQSMVGLSEIKELVNQIINTEKIRKARSKLGMDNHGIARHMVFTGNPGSAKTTVARLIAEILRKEGILETGKLIECGRGDLVAKYVGWTAKTVSAKFRSARGGVLFIDEAYALVDRPDSFGTEAINTIVQEMENHRDDVIVIFAGYPGKMEEFLAQNEGLRSRIAFHLNFPDYNPNEMVQILELMAKERGFELGDEVEEKCLSIFGEACKKPDFGNGRFARNLLEQAVMRQSARIVEEFDGAEIGREALTTLIVDDFSVNAEKQTKKEKTTIGFVA